MKGDKIDELKALLAPPIEVKGAFLVDLNVRGEGRRQIIEVFCETESGITIDECAGISREILPLIDASKLMGDNYRLEVSSPGVGSVLKDRRQYKRNIGRLLSVKYQVGGEETNVEGELSDLAEDRISLTTGTGTVEIPLDTISEARVKIRW